MATSSPIRIDAEIHAAAKLADAVMSRSTAQQLAHWARIGRELETAEGVSHAAIARVLAGRVDYGDLNTEEQAVVRAEWTQRLHERGSGLNLAEAFSAQGRSWVDLDDDENVAHHPASPANG